MRILLTGAGGNIGRGLVPRLLDAGHDLVLSDLARPEGLPDLPFHPLDVQEGFGLEKAAEGATSSSTPPRGTVSTGAREPRSTSGG